MKKGVYHYLKSEDTFEDVINGEVKLIVQFPSLVGIRFGIVFIR